MNRKRYFSAVLKSIGSEDRNPESLARGLGIGLFVAFLPLPAFQALIALGAAHFLGVNRGLAIAGTLITNWFTMPIVFLAAVWTGSAMLPAITVEGIVPASFAFEDLRLVSQEVLVAYLVGTFLFAFLSGTFGYVLMKIYAENREQNRWRNLENL